MKKFLLASFFCAFLFINLFFKKNIYAQEIIYGTNRIITRAEVAKMISFVYGNKKDILECYKNREINFLDSEINDWFDKYINFVFEKKIMTGTNENKFEPEKYLNLNQAQILLDKIKDLQEQGFFISTDLIVGFPTETENDFQQIIFREFQ